MTVHTTRIRNRAENPSVAKGPVQPKMRDLVEFSFAEGLEQQFAHILKIDGKASEVAMADLTDVARSHLTWKDMSISSREVVRADLVKIASLGSADELQSILLRLDQGTEHHLWAQLKSTPDWPAGQNAVHWLRAEPDLGKVRAAAVSAVEAMRGGDYSNTNLHFVVSALFDIFNANSSENATVGRRESRAPLPRLVRLFFEQVDPELPWNTIWNALDREARARRSVTPS